MDRTLQAPDDLIPAPLQPVMQALCQVAADLLVIIARGPLGDALGAEVGNNTDGDNQKALDVIADELFAKAVKGTGVRWYASEEREDVVGIDPQGGLGLAIDPLDGSSNIDVNLSIGTIFSIRQALDGADETFLRSGRDQIAAGYLIYGPQTALVVTFGGGVQFYVLDPVDRMFKLVNRAVTIPSASSEFAINASNYRHWGKPVRAYIDDCLAGSDGPRQQNFNMRWVASLVAETHRIMTRGGIFLYPSDSRPGYEQGRLRMVYECAPIAMLIEQAHGRATTGTDPLLDRIPTTLHARTPFVFGSAGKVDRVTAYHDLPDQEISALFGTRGLFRS